MGWFSDRSLRFQWRLAQVVLGIPLFGFAVVGLVMLGMLFVDPAWTWSMLRGVGAAGWWTLAVSLTGISLIEHHLQASPRPAFA